jgi:hypothetical protein
MKNASITLTQVDTQEAANSAADKATPTGCQPQPLFLLVMFLSRVTNPLKFPLFMDVLFQIDTSQLHSGARSCVGLFYLNVETPIFADEAAEVPIPSSVRTTNLPAGRGWYRSSCSCSSCSSPPACFIVAASCSNSSAPHKQKPRCSFRRASGFSSFR